VAVLTVIIGLSIVMVLSSSSTEVSALLVSNSRLSADEVFEKVLKDRPETVKV
jgi:hypothetical protein